MSHARLTDRLSAFRNGDRAFTVVAFGDSVTMGYTGTGQIDPENVYHARVRRLLHLAYPQLVVNMINAGVAGGTCASSLARLERDALCHRPDAMIIAFGLNDSHGYQAGLAGFKESLSRVITQARAAGVRWFVLVTPSFMATKENIRISENDRRHVANIVKATASGTLASYAQGVREVAQAHGTGLADVYAHWEALAKAGVDTDTLLANGLNHPTSQAHSIHADRVFEALMGL